MIKESILAATIALSGCTVYGGVAYHAMRLDQPEIGLNNPLGVVGARHEFNDHLEGYCEHQSGIFQQEAGYGMNECGANLKVDIK